jgi:hypothetical protein
LIYQKNTISIILMMKIGNGNKIICANPQNLRAKKNALLLAESQNFHNRRRAIALPAGTTTKAIPARRAEQR